MTLETPHSQAHLAIWNQLKPQEGATIIQRAHEVLIYGPLILDTQRALYSWFFDTTYLVSPNDVRRQIDRIEGDTVIFRINSPGGNVAATAAIRALVQETQASGKTTYTIIDGLAGSGASIIALSAPRPQRTIAELGQIFIHGAQSYIPGLFQGSQHDARRVAAQALQVADELEALDQTIHEVYIEETTAPTEQITQWMDDKTFLSSAQALEHGFAADYFKGTLPAAYAEDQPQDLQYKATASLEGTSLFPFADPLAQETVLPSILSIKDPVMSRSSDALVRQTLGLAASEAITDDHRDQALTRLDEQATQSRSTLFAAQVDTLLARHAERGVLTAAQCQEHKTRLAQAPDPEWALSFLEQTLTAQAPPADPSVPQGHSQQPPAPTDPDRSAQADLFRLKVAELEQTGLSFGDAVLQAKHQLGDPSYEAYAYHTHETTGTPGVGV